MQGGGLCGFSYDEVGYDGDLRGGKKGWYVRRIYIHNSVV